MATLELLKIKNLGCVRQQHPVFAHLSFGLGEGELMIVEGPNGSGKSSLLRLLAGLASPDQGEIRWQEELLEHTRENYHANMHFLGHTNGLKLGLTIDENLNLAAKLNQLPLPPNLDEVLSSLQLINQKNILVKFLSAGQKRRIALTKLFIFPKRLWLVDEPFTALDNAMQSIFSSKLEQHLTLGGMCVLSTHHPISLVNRRVQTLRMDLC